MPFSTNLLCVPYFIFRPTLVSSEPCLSSHLSNSPLQSCSLRLEQSPSNGVFKCPVCIEGLWREGLWKSQWLSGACYSDWAHMQSPVIHWGTGCYCSLAVVSELSPANTVLAVHCNATLGDFTKRDGYAYLYLVCYVVVNVFFLT